MIDASLDIADAARVVITSTFDTEPVHDALAFWFAKLGYVRELAPNVQVFDRITDASALVSTQRRGFNLIVLRPEDWHESGSSDTTDIERQCSAFIEELRSATTHEVHRSLCVCPVSLTARADAALVAACDRVDAMLAARFATSSDVTVLSSSALVALQGTSGPAYEEGGDRVTPSFAATIATAFARGIHRLLTKPYEVLVVDAEHVLGSGGDDGVRAFALAQLAGGMRLCVVARSAAAAAQVLGDGARERLASVRAGDEPIATKLRALSEELGSPLDTFIVLTAEPVVFAGLEGAEADVVALELPASPAAISGFLANVWAFDCPPLPSTGRALKSLARARMVRPDWGRIAAQLTDSAAVTREMSAGESKQRDRYASGTPFVAPRTSLEEQVARIWEKVLGFDRLGVNDEFFDLGGDSLLLLQISAQLSESLGIDLPIRTLFDAPTVSGLAAALEDASRSARAPIEHVERGPTLTPMSSQQRLIYHAARSNPGEHRCHMMSYRIRGPLELEAFTRALRATVCAHPVLSATLADDAGTPALHIHPERATTVSVVDLTPLPDPMSELERRVRERCVLFDVGRVGAALGSLEVFRVAPDEHVLFVLMHTIIADGVAWWLLEREIWSAYDAVLTGAVVANRSHIEFRDFVAWEERLASAPTSAAALDYWKRHCAGATPLPLFRSPRRAYGSLPDFQRVTTWDDRTRARFADTARGMRVSQAHLGFLVYGLALTRFAGRSDAWIQVPRDLRLQHHEFGATIGNLLFTSLLRFHAEPGEALETVAVRVRDVYTAMLGYDGAPLAAVLGTPAASRHPLAQATYIVAEPGRIAAAATASVPPPPALLIDRVPPKEPGGQRSGLLFTFLVEPGTIYVEGSSEFFDEGDFHAFTRSFDDAVLSVLDGTSIPGQAGGTAAESRKE